MDPIKAKLRNIILASYLEEPEKQIFLNRLEEQELSLEFFKDLQAVFSKAREDLQREQDRLIEESIKNFKTAEAQLNSEEKNQKVVLRKQEEDKELEKVRRSLGKS